MKCEVFLKYVGTSGTLAPFLGPALSGVSNRIPSMQGWLIDYLLRPDSLIAASDVYMLKLLEKYPDGKWHRKNQGLDESMISDIAGYLLMLK